jgi:hypothetical protein
MTSTSWWVRSMALSGVYSFSRGWRATYDVEKKGPLLYMDRCVFSLHNGIIGMCPPFMLLNVWRLGRRVEIWKRGLVIENPGDFYVEMNHGVCTDIF